MNYRIEYPTIVQTSTGVRVGINGVGRFSTQAEAESHLKRMNSRYAIVAPFKKKGWTLKAEDFPVDQIMRYARETA